MVVNEIFLGSGASITKVPELDILIKTATTGTVDTITIHSSFTDNFSLVNNLYVGCTLKKYNTSSKAYESTHRITKNTDTTITFFPSANMTGNANTSYFVIENYGAPCPAPKVSSGTSSHIEQVLNIAFSSDTRTDYTNDSISFGQVPAPAGSSSTAFVIGLQTTGSYGGASADLVIDLQDTDLNSATDFIDEIIAQINSATQSGIHFTAARSGNNLVITNDNGGTVSQSPTATNVSGTDLTLTTTVVGSTTSNTASKRLMSDSWLGIAESITFPTTEIEMKQTNLSLGGSRNWTYQYKGIETAGTADLNLIANHGSWLYYFFGKCSGISIADNVPNGTPPSSEYVGNANDLYINYGSTTDTGPLFFRSIGGVMTPPVDITTETRANLDKVANLPAMSSGSIQNAITYTFEEQNADVLPSFALEQVFSKLPSTNTYRTNIANDDEDTNFVKIARGCRVNTLSMTANENEEVKFNISCNTRNVHTLDKTESYDARRGVVDETTFFNFTSVNEFREPFFFSDGTLKAFSQDFFKITSLTLTMNNTLTDKRFLGIGNKSVQDAIPAQRTYEIQITGYATDDKLYNELINNTEDTSNNIELIFTKANGENITLKFKDYFLSANEFPMADDKGPIEITGTIMPRNLVECTVKTHWHLLG